MAMKVATFNGCKVYNLSSGKTMPAWLSQTKKRALAKDEDYRKRVELIQDFEMPTASQCIEMTQDREHIIVTGTYPPVVKCYTTSDLALKFQRGLTAEVVAMKTLSDDFGKLVFLQNDRTLNFHAPYGTHYSVRVPKFGRDLAYNWDSCDLYVAASGDEIYRLNLEAGQFREPFNLQFSGCNKIHINPVHNLLGFGGEQGICEFWDPRERKSISTIDVRHNNPSVSRDACDVTELKFDSNGLTLAVGTSGGNCILYDIRSSKPFYTKDHQYGVPIVDITFHNSSRHVISTDKKIVKIWERDEQQKPNRGAILTNIETPADINGITFVEDQRGPTGLMMLAGEQGRMMTYFVPQLGPAPRWSSFLENITEELEETSGQTVYDDYKFVTQQELEDLGATGLIGSSMLKGYMHGFFMEMKLYNKLRAVSKPFEYEEYRKKKIRDKIEQNRQSRITARKRLPKVNKELAEKLIKRGGGKDPEKALIDDRFSSLFEREEFQQDEEAVDFKLRNPTRAVKRGGGDDSDDDLAELYQEVKEDDVNEDDASENFDDWSDVAGSGAEDSGEEPSVEEVEFHNSDDEDKFDSAKKRRSSAGKRGPGGKEEEEEEEGAFARASKKILERRESVRSAPSTPKVSRHSLLATAKKSTNKSVKKSAMKTPKMYELSEGYNASAAVFGHSTAEKSLRRTEKSRANVPIVERLEETKKSGLQNTWKDWKRKSGGESSKKPVVFKETSGGLVREMSYFPKNNGKKPRVI